jgi:hypothetical protein
VATAAEEGAEVVAVGPNIETFCAVDSKADRGKGDFENLELIDPDAPWGSIDRLSFAGQFVKRYAVFLDGRNHGGNLVELTRELLEGSFNGSLIERGDGAGFEDFSSGVLGVCGFPKFKGSLVLLVFGHQEILNASSPTDDEHEEPGRDGVEGAAVADLTLIKAAANKIDDIVGGSSGGFIDQEKAVELWNHGIWVGTKVKCYNAKEVRK